MGTHPFVGVEVALALVLVSYTVYTLACSAPIYCKIANSC